MASKETTPMNVLVESELTVPLCMPVLDHIDDGGLRREIAEEAVRLAVCERLGGIDAVVVEEFTGQRQLGPRQQRPKYLARVDFNILCDAIAALQAEHQRVLELAKTALDVVDAASATEPAADDTNVGTSAAVCNEALKTIGDALRSMTTPPPQSAAASGDRVVAKDDGEEWTADERKEFPPLIHSGDDDDDDGDDAENNGDCRGSTYDPVAAGYAPL